MSGPSGPASIADALRLAAALVESSNGVAWLAFLQDAMKTYRGGDGPILARKDLNTGAAVRRHRDETMLGAG